MLTTLQIILVTICLIIGIYKGVIKDKYEQGAFWLCLAIFVQLGFIIDKLIIIK